MNDPKIVGASQGGAHLLQDVDAALNDHRTARKFCGERCSDKVFHHEVELAVISLADIGNVNDVCMVDAIRRTRLAQHPGTKVRFATKIRTNKLNGDNSVNEHMASTIDGT